MCMYANAKIKQYKDGNFAFQSFIKFLGFVWVKKKLTKFSPQPKKARTET